MRHTGLIAVLSIALVLALLIAGQAEPPTILDGKLLTQDGVPVTNQPIVIEGYKERGLPGRWVAAWLNKQDWNELRVQAVTDQRGAFQVINLPAGYYTLKLLRPGSAPIPIKEFKWDGGYSKKEIAGEVSFEQLGRQTP